MQDAAHLLGGLLTLQFSPSTVVLELVVPAPVIAAPAPSPDHDAGSVVTLTSDSLLRIYDLLDWQVLQPGLEPEAELSMEAIVLIQVDDDFAPRYGDQQ